MRTNKTHIDVVAKRGLRADTCETREVHPPHRTTRRIHLQVTTTQLATRQPIYREETPCGRAQFLDQLHITSGARSGLLKGSSERRCSCSPTTIGLLTLTHQLQHQSLGHCTKQMRPRFDKLEKLAYFWKSFGRLRRCNGDSFSEIRCNLDWNRASETRSSSNSPVAGWSSAGTKSPRCSRDHCSKRRSRTPRGTRRRLCLASKLILYNVRWMWRTWTTPSFRMI